MARKKRWLGAPPPPLPWLLEPDEGAPELLELEELEELEEEDELLLELEEELELEDEEELDEEEPVYSSAPMSKAVPVGRGSPSMSTDSPVMVVPPLTTPAMAEVRWRSHAVGSVNQKDRAVVKLVARVAVPLSRAAMGLFVRLLRIWTPEVSA
jgi:hypothetical protein